MNLKHQLRTKWAELEDESMQLTTMMDELEEIDHEEKSPQNTTAYILMQQKLKWNQDMQMFLEKNNIFKD